MASNETVYLSCTACFTCLADMIRQSQRECNKTASSFSHRSMSASIGGCCMPLLLEGEDRKTPRHEGIGGVPVAGFQAREKREGKGEGEAGEAPAELPWGQASSRSGGLGSPPYGSSRTGEDSYSRS